MTLVQILAIGLVILILIKTAADFKKRKITLRLFLFWIVIWLAILTVAVLPNVTAFFAKFLGVGRGIDVAVYFSILFIFFALFKIITKLEKIENDITAVIRNEAIKNSKKNEDSLN